MERTANNCEKVARDMAGMVVTIKTYGGPCEVRVVGWTMEYNGPWVVVESSGGGDVKPEAVKFTTAAAPGGKLTGYGPHMFETTNLVVDTKRFPHRCKCCNSPAFRGFNMVDCTNKTCAHPQ